MRQTKHIIIYSNFSFPLDKMLFLQSRIKVPGRILEEHREPLVV
jgi:hypothetical protein